MKLTVISRKTNWCVTELVRAGKKRGVKVAIVDFNDIDSALKFKGWGDVVIWRSSSLDAAIERSILFRFLKKQGKVIINEGQATNPLVVNKFFQQQIIAQHSGVSGHDSMSGIPSYVFTTSNELSLAIKNKKLTFPFIEKPVLGAHGQGVRKIGAISDVVTTRENVYQNYIPNDGDYRVICLGGRVLGAIKRTATPGDFRNNISQGGSAALVTDKEALRIISSIALKASLLFNISLCGVDIIYDTKSKKYLFLEINTLVWWEKFQDVHLVNVADEIIKNCIARYHGKTSQDTFSLAEHCYQDNFSSLPPSKQFHFCSRRLLWSDDKKSRAYIKASKSSYLGDNPEELTVKIKKILEEVGENRSKGDIRDPYLKKYPQLKAYNQILFKVLFASTLYNQDIRSVVAQVIDTKDLIKLKHRIEKDHKGMAILSTLAVNFIYNLEFFLYKKEVGSFIDIKRYYEKTRHYYEKDKEVKANYNLQLYFLTHAIINESRFYSRRITRNKSVYLEILKNAEQVILEHYTEIALDNKIEFLVCCRILQVSSPLFTTILSECSNSLSDYDNYLVDRHNVKTATSKSDLATSEHCNVLFLMAYGKSTIFNKS